MMEIQSPEHKKMTLDFFENESYNIIDCSVSR